MDKLAYPLIALTFLTQGCTIGMANVQSATTSALTPMQLIATIEAHKGQAVTVVGYFTYATDTRALWENEAAHRDAEHLREGSWDKCITIYPSDPHARRFTGRHVHITGKVALIDRKDIRSFWTCNPVAVENAIITLG
jgi:hypothetical protein